MDTNRIALYLSWHLPPYYKPFDKWEFLDLMRWAAGWLFTIEELNFLNAQSNGDKQQFYSMCLHKLQKANIADFNRVIRSIDVPDDVMWVKQVDDRLIVSNDEVNKDYEHIKNELARYKKPIVVTEWKTDVTILKTAWEKLYPSKIMPFDILESWFDVEPENMRWKWSASALKAQLEYSYVISEYKTIIWIFDNDREWSEAFDWLNHLVFEKSSKTSTIKSRLSWNITALLLPAPSIRKSYVKTNFADRHLCIEHYFSDEVLKSYDMLVEWPSKKVFRIKDWWKKWFSDNVCKLPPEEFNNFIKLFDLILKYI